MFQEFSFSHSHLPHKEIHVNAGYSATFILPASPWWGGFYNRLVRSVKGCLKKTLGKAFIPFEELKTILYEIEFAINNRQLAHVSEDDLEEALMPFHLMYGRSIATGEKFLSTDVVSVMSLEHCKKRLLHLRKLLKDLWSRFRSNYLATPVDQSICGRLK